MNPIILIQTLARAVYNRSPEPLGHFSDSQSAESREEVSRSLSQRMDEEHAAAVSSLLKVVGIVVVLAVIVGVMLFH
jgi:hypothetical protein